MILFKKAHIEPILEGKKTQTRRTWVKQRVRVGSVHQARTGYYGKPFAYIRITAVRRERLGQISEADARAEGYESIETYQEVFRRIYKQWDPDMTVWVVDFELSEAKRA